MRRFLSGSFILVLTAGILLPFLPLLIWAFSRQWLFPDLLPETWGLRAWNYVFGVAGPQVTSALVTSVSVSSLAALFSVALALPAARVLTFSGRKRGLFLQFLFVLPILTPPLSVSMGLHLWFLKLGLTGSLPGVLLVHLTLCVPYAVFVLSGVFSNYNPLIEAQARSLGASKWFVFSRVTLPLILPGIIVAALFAFLLSWSQYLNTLIIGGSKVMTLPVLLFSLLRSGDRPVAAAVSLVIVLPAFAALLISARTLGRRAWIGGW
ncbi:MAG: ABC transporter permease subunit [candidate division KSB1 bacterium]|nr:ABC transporter permease subunit [candidate division KSB1 bacterium]